MTSEAAIQVGVKRFLRRLGKECYFFKVHGDVYAAGEPDFVGAYRGRAFIIETKMPGNFSTPLQSAVQHKWEQAGAVVCRDVTHWEQVHAAFVAAGLDPVEMEVACSKELPESSH